MAEWLFDRKGKACLFLYYDRFIDSDGHTVGWLVNNNVYAMDGKHIGWFENDVLYDGHNRTIAFQRDAIVCLPSVPWTEAAPGIPPISEEPEKPDLRGEPGRPGYAMGWSDEDIAEFFCLEHHHL